MSGNNFLYVPFKASLSNFGLGVNSAKMEPTGISPFLNPPSAKDIEKLRAPSWQTKDQVIYSESDSSMNLSMALNFGEEVDAVAAQESNQLDLKTNLSHRGQTITLYGYSTSLCQTAWQYTEKQIQELKPVEADNSENFTKTYGDYFVAGFMLGAVFIYRVDLHSESTELSVEVAAKLKSNTSFSDVKAEISGLMESHKGSLNCQTNVSVIGGDPVEHTDTTGIDGLAKTMSDWEKSARNIDDGGNRCLAILRPIAPLLKKGIGDNNSSQNQVRRKVGLYYKELNGVLNDIEFIRANKILFDPKKQTTDKVEADVEHFKNQIQTEFEAFCNSEKKGTDDLSHISDLFIKIKKICIEKEPKELSDYLKNELPRMIEISAKAIKWNNRGKKLEDKEYKIFVGDITNLKEVNLYCADMGNPDTPGFEYLSVQSSNIDKKIAVNGSAAHKGNCSIIVKTRDKNGAGVSNILETYFDKLRIDPRTLKVDTSDFRFTRTYSPDNSNYALVYYNNNKTSRFDALQYAHAWGTGNDSKHTGHSVIQLADTEFEIDFQRSRIIGYGGNGVLTEEGANFRIGFHENDRQFAHLTGWGDSGGGKIDPLYLKVTDK